ncbi:Uncharacterized protein BP5553_02020 [Venustampulla echinocandica]|uniref:AA9 family lytic polysaccharide monooxygenase n=1 Tax=Venustampulla echinocandica TaxID=2656787 RepID=A0A370U2P3_9HELO|nr:Uncharacterized protein BP5553_02020 [Venustampulla echinocandica]RDL42041.1 Uncharacterized protein BP5553_02020 [Venustampulla echinocandica]
MKPQVITSIICLVTTAVGHGGVCSYTIDGVQYKGNLWHIEGLTGEPLPDPPAIPSIQRRWDYMPILDPTSSNMTCNYDGTATPSSLHAPIEAGSNITAHWDNFMPNVWPDGWHHADGPLFAYMAACPGDSCEGFDGSGAVWFKINQLGLKPDAQDLRGPWIQGDLLLSGNRVPPGYTVTIPKNLKPGKYLIRHEIIMVASIPAQIYPDCAQLTVTGEGTMFPDHDYLVSFPGAYSATDPGIAMADWVMTGGGSPIKPEWKTTDYPFPGPAVWTGE